VSEAAAAAVRDAAGSLARALDAGSWSDVERASAALARATQALGAAGGHHLTPELKDAVRHALAESAAARIRTRYLAEHSRQRLDRLHALTGRSAQRYGRTGRYL